MTDQRRTKTGGFTLIELLIVIIIIGILAAIAIPMFLGQRDKAKESAVKGGIHNIELGIGSYAVDNGDTYPAQSFVHRATLVDGSGAPYVDNWPKNPWDTTQDMDQGSGRGDFQYSKTSTMFLLVGLGKAGTPIFSAP